MCTVLFMYVAFQITRNTLELFKALVPQVYYFPEFPPCFFKNILSFWKFLLFIYLSDLYPPVWDLNLRPWDQELLPTEPVRRPSSMLFKLLFVPIMNCRCFYIYSHNIVSVFDKSPLVSGYSAGCVPVSEKKRARWTGLSWKHRTDQLRTALCKRGSFCSLRYQRWSWECGLLLLRVLLGWGQVNGMGVN